jgi:hypothetical protein
MLLNKKSLPNKKRKFSVSVAVDVALIVWRMSPELIVLISRVVLCCWTADELAKCLCDC